MGADGPAWTATLRGYDALTILERGRVLSTPGMAALRAGRLPDASRPSAVRLASASRSA